MPPPVNPLRDEVVAAVAAELERVGPDAFAPRDVVARFEGRGSSRTTLYRWVKEAMDSGAPAQALTEKIKAAAAERAARTPEPAAEAAVEIVAKLPKVVRLEDVATAGQIPVIEQLNVCLATAHKLLAHAQTDDGKVKNARLLLQSSEHLRRCLETAARIADLMRQVNEVDRFHALVIEKISARDPMLAEELLHDLTVLSAQWAVG